MAATDDLLGTHRLTSQLREAAPQLPTREQLQALCAEIRRIVEVGNPDAVKQLLRELIDRVEITPDRRAYPYFWVPASCDPAPTTDERGPNAQPAPSHQEDTGWPFMTNREVFTFGPDQVFCGVIGAPPTG